MALVVFFCLSDFPEEAKWLKPDEKAFVTARLRADQGHAARESKVTLKKVGGILSEFRVIIAGVMYFGLIVPAYSYAYFSPTIIRGFGYTPIQTQLHSVPPWLRLFGFATLPHGAYNSLADGDYDRRAGGHGQIDGRAVAGPAAGG